MYRILTMSFSSTISVSMSEEDQKLFVEFQKNYELWKTLENVGITRHKGGEVVLVFNSDGVISNVKLYHGRHLYKYVPLT